MAISSQSAQVVHMTKSDWSVSVANVNEKIQTTNIYGSKFRIPDLFTKYADFQRFNKMCKLYIYILFISTEH